MKNPSGIYVLIFLTAMFLSCKKDSAVNGKFDIEDISIEIISNYNYKIKVRLIQPKYSKYRKESFPAVLRIGGGWGGSTFLLNSEQTRNAASEGLIIVAFDSEPKIEEEVGSSLRDYNGFKDQDDVATVLEFIFNLVNVNTSNVGIWSHSNGITLASGVLGRAKYQHLSKKIVFLLDDEGPHNPADIINNPEIQFHTAGIKEMWETVINAKLQTTYQTEDEFFAERCAINFIGGFKGIYQRVQAIDDHEVSSYHGHAVAMINAATTPNGKAIWTKLNRCSKNQLYKSQQYPDGINIEAVLDVEKFNSANDSRIWETLLELVHQ